MQSRDVAPLKERASDVECYCRIVRDLICFCVMLRSSGPSARSRMTTLSWFDSIRGLYKSNSQVHQTSKGHQGSKEQETSEVHQAGRVIQAIEVFVVFNIARDVIRGFTLCTNPWRR